MKGMTKLEAERYAELILKWRAKPDTFIEEIFGATPEVWQREACRNIAAHDRLAIRSGHGVGKSAWLSWMVWWWLTTNRDAIVAITAPSSTQMFDVLYTEARRWLGKMPPLMRELWDVKVDRIEFKEDPERGFATFRTARKEQPEAFAGLHAPNMLFLVDEASGVDDVIFETGEGAMSTPGAKTVMCGNPTRASGYFHSAFHRSRELWKTMKVSSADSTRVSKRYPEEMAKKYGEFSNVYRVRVLGEFPKSDDDTVIPLDLVEAAVNRDVESTGGGVVWGLDVARFGDDSTALAKRRSNHLLEPVKEWRGLDLMQTTARVTREFHDTDPDERPEVIYVDSIGLGAGVVDRLHELNLPVVGINVAEQPGDKEKYLRLRDQIWFDAREWFFARDCRIPDDEGLIGELTCIRWKPTDAGKVKVESKHDAKKRGIQSPNKADAFNLTFAGGFRMEVGTDELCYPELVPDW